MLRSLYNMEVRRKVKSYQFEDNCGLILKNKLASQTVRYGKSNYKIRQVILHSRLTIFYRKAVKKNEHFSPRHTPCLRNFLLRASLWFGLIL